MARIIVAFPDPEAARKISAALEGAGYQIFRVCGTGNEVMRAFTLCQDGILICGTRFSDRTADSLAWDLGDQAVILVVARPDQLETCEHPKIFRRPLPVSRTELISAVDMLLQMHEHRMPRRDKEEKELIRRAKEKLRETQGLSEPEAHRLLQKAAMRRGLRLTQCAEKILAGEYQAE